MLAVAQLFIKWIRSVADDDVRDVTFQNVADLVQLMKADAIRRIGFLDENTFLYFEEPILAEMLNNSGYQVWHCGLSTVVHNHGETISSTFNKNDICSFLVDSLKYYLKHYRRMNKIKIAICVLFKKIVFLRRK